MAACLISTLTKMKIFEYEGKYFSTATDILDGLSKIDEYRPLPMPTLFELTEE